MANGPGPLRVHTSEATPLSPGAKSLDFCAKEKVSFLTSGGMLSPSLWEAVSPTNDKQPFLCPCVTWFSGKLGQCFLGLHYWPLYVCISSFSHSTLLTARFSEYFSSLSNFLSVPPRRAGHQGQETGAAGVLCCRVESRHPFSSLRGGGGRCVL